VVGAGSRPANDLAQWVFALYVALALRHTTRVRGHMAADTLASRYPPRVRARLWRWGQTLCVLPWALFVLISAAPQVWQSLRTFEAFPDTFNPLYFIVKCAVWLLALLLALQALADLLTSSNTGTE
jgi:TRAP-type mannitol/chloroaromatic compound transport system permease small subunit